MADSDDEPFDDSEHQDPAPPVDPDPQQEPDWSSMDPQFVRHYQSMQRAMANMASRLREAERTAAAARAASTPAASTPDPSVSGGTLSERLGLANFRSTARGEQVGPFMGIPLCTLAQREAMKDPVEKNRIYTQAVRGLKNKLSAPKTFEDLKKLTSMADIIAVEKLNEELYMQLWKFGVDVTFQILPVNAAGDALLDLDTHPPVNLFTEMHKTTFEALEKHVKYIDQYGSPVHRENLMWSYEFIMNSIDDKLKSTINDKLTSYPSHMNAGPIVYWLVQEQLTSTDPAALFAVEEQLRKVRASDFPGEHIPSMSAVLLGGVNWLARCNYKPGGLDTMFWRSYESCSNADFCNELKIIKRTSKPPLTCRQITIEADAIYKRMVMDKVFEPGLEPSAFLGHIQRKPSPWAPPKPGEPTEKVIFGKMRYFCKEHQFWESAKECTNCDEHLGKKPRRRRKKKSDGGSEAGTSGGSAAPASFTAPGANNVTRTYQFGGF